MREKNKKIIIIWYWEIAIPNEYYNTKCQILNYIKYIHLVIDKVLSMPQ